MYLSIFFFTFSLHIRFLSTFTYFLDLSIRFSHLVSTFRPFLNKLDLSHLPVLRPLYKLGFSTHSPTLSDLTTSRVYLTLYLLSDFLSTSWVSFIITYFQTFSLKVIFDDLTPSTEWLLFLCTPFWSLSLSPIYTFIINFLSSFVHFSLLLGHPPPLA